MESKVDKLLSWSRKHIYDICLSVIILVAVCSILVILCFRNMKDPATVKISIPENISESEKKLKIGYVVNKKKCYKVTNGANLSADAAKEVVGLVSSLNKTTSMVNDLVDIAQEALTQKSTKETKEFTIPVNAWCDADVEGCASYQWIENNKNYFSEPLNSQEYKVVIVKSMAIYITYKSLGADVVVYEIQQ